MSKVPPTRRETHSQRPQSPAWRRRSYEIIFEANTRAGRWFDVGLMIAILVSITLVALETVQEFQPWTRLFLVGEIIVTIIFTIEYVLRLISVRRPLRYALSFWGLVDLLSILPTYVAPFLGPTSRSFVTIRAIRLLRVFRVLKLWRMMDEADDLASAVWRSRNKIIVFLTVVVVAITISATLMYHVEALMATESEFTSIPQAMYWAIVTMTTVGYGDVVPRSPAGKMISAVLILIGYSLIIVPSAFVTTELIQAKQPSGQLVCGACGAAGQRPDAGYCYRCSERLRPE